MEEKVRPFRLAISYALLITPGLAEDRGITNVQMLQLAYLRYNACLALGVSAAPQPSRRFALAARKYARFRHIGPDFGLEAATQTLVGDRLPAAGWQPADCPTIHQFVYDPDTTHAKHLVTAIPLPLTTYPE
jgi:DNA gyrase inhibitor GyrI